MMINEMKAVLTKGVFWSLLCFLTLLATPLYAPVYAQGAAENATETVPVEQLEDEALHSRLVNVALDLDLFNEQCRGLSVNRNFNKVNRLFINKYSLSANNYIESFFRQEIRVYKKIKQQQFIQTLASLKGCKGAKKAGWDKQLKSDYNILLRKAEDSGWFPVVDRIAPADL